MSNPPPLEPGKFYHVYNRGNNRENLFMEGSCVICVLALHRLKVDG